MDACLLELEERKCSAVKDFVS